MNGSNSLEDDPCIWYNGTAQFKKLSNCLNTNIYPYVETCGGQSSNLYINVFHFVNTSVNETAHFKICKQLFEYQHLLIFRDIWW
jgi:hypothetical protein